MNQALELGAVAPLYKAVKQLLTQELAAGEWRPGEALPSEAKLAERFGVSIGTVRKAIDELVAERMVVRHQGRGTFVASHNTSRQLFHFFHIVPHAGDRQHPRTETLAFRRGRAESGEAARLRVATGEPVFRIRNLLRLEGRAVALDDLVLTQAQFPDLTEKIFTGRANTIYHLYQTRYGINVLRTSERLRATLAGADVAKLLGVRKGAPLLEINRVALTYHDVPVELRRSLVNTEQHEYFSDLGKDEAR
ncbi:MAG: GntR family transcriptional regulator [Betaproteobacteria bacterium]|nr:GntR family transcriptional regulator [Betaproteobacteria bacterium]